MRRLLSAFLLLATLALLAALWLQVPGANGPGEWRWEYRPPSLAAGPAATVVLLAALMISAALARGGRFAGSRPGLALLVLLGFLLTLAVTGAQPGGFDRVLAALASRHSFSYVYDAGVAPGTAELLADFPAASERLDLHSRTHPPGPLLLVRALDALTRPLPVIDGGRTQGLTRSATDALAREIARARERHRPAPDRPPGPWAIVALAFLLPALAALAAWPLHRLARVWGLPPEAQALAVLLWLLTPARSLFTPSLDQALPLLLTGAAALVATPGPGGLGRTRAFVAGLLAAAACFLSYGCLALLPWLALVTLGAEASSPERPWPWPPRSAWVRAALLGGGFLVPWLVVVVGFGGSPVRDFRAAIAAHRAMAVATRGYATWVGWNLYDFTLFLGPAVLALALVALRPVAPGGRSCRWGIWGFWGLLALLDLSGSVRGEVGRIWLFFMPFAGLFAAAAISVISAPADGERRPVGSAVLALLELALLLSLAANLIFIA
jgi:hypothetical protein